MWKKTDTCLLWKVKKSFLLYDFVYSPVMAGSGGGNGGGTGGAGGGVLEWFVGHVLELNGLLSLKGLLSIEIVD